MKPITIWTIGHSTRTEEKFKDILLAHEIKALVDVRSYPGSRRLPHFNKEHLAESLPKIGIEYYHEKRLGGRRTARKDSKNTGLRDPGFRGYADYMETDEFKKVSRRCSRSRKKNPPRSCALKPFTCVVIAV